MPVPTDPILILLTAIVLWSFWAACVLRDKLAGADPETPSLGARLRTSMGDSRVLFCGLCGGPHDYDDCPLEEDAEPVSKRPNVRPEES